MHIADEIGGISIGCLAFSCARVMQAGTLEGHVRAVTSMIFVGTLLWSASLDMTIRVWDVVGTVAIMLAAQLLSPTSAQIAKASTPAFCDV
jgi:hypothetical protein